MIARHVKLESTNINFRGRIDLLTDVSASPASESRALIMF